MDFLLNLPDTMIMNRKSNPKPKSEFAGSAKLETVPSCPACSHTKGFTVKMASVYECGACHALYGHCYLGDSYGYVLPFFAEASVPAERQRYFDFETLGSQGVGRRHGWFDPMTRRITQVG